MNHNAAGVFALSLIFTSVSALAQPTAKGTQPPEETKETPQPEPQQNPPPAAPVPRPDVLAETLRPVPAGLTLEAVAEQAMATSHTVAVKRTEIEAAAAELDQALVAYFPTATLTASYTRLSPVDNTLAGFAIPSVLNNYSFTAGLVVPVSDYLLRLSQAYASASKSEQAKRIEAQAEQLKVAADAKVALLDWVRAKGQRAVATMAVEQSRAHVAQTEALLEVGVAARADLLRLQAQVADAEHLERTAGVVEALAAKQLRTLLHIDDATAISSGVDVLNPPTEAPRRLVQLERQALSQRLELKALDLNERALDEADTAAHAAYYPRVDAFANTLLANPNPRIFSQSDQFDLTWNVNVRLTWIINESFATAGATRATSARRDAVRSQKSILADAIKLEIARAHLDGERARSALLASDRKEVALEAALDAWLERYKLGKARSTDLVDAETELTRARLQRVDAHIDLLVALVRLDHAVGRPTSTRSRQAR